MYNNNNTQLSHRTNPFSQGHGIRSSIVSAIRRKGSALVSLSAMLRGSRSSHRDPWTTDLDEERPSASHLENVTSPRYGSWSARHNKTSNYRNRQFWTVSGARSGTKTNSTDTDHTPRMSKARSFVQSLRNKRGTFQTDYTSEGERNLAAWNSNGDSSDGAVPLLALPSDCAGSTETQSAFWLGVQNAVQDTVDENFSLHAECGPSHNSSPDLEEQQTTGSNVAEEQHDWPSHQCRRPSHFFCRDILQGQPAWEPRNSITDWPCLQEPEHIPQSLYWICDARGPSSGPSNTRDTDSPREETGIHSLFQAFEDLNADLQKRSSTASRETLDARNAQLRKLRLAIESLAEALSPGVHNHVPGEAEEWRDQETAKDEPSCTETQDAMGSEQASGSDLSCVSEGSVVRRGRSENTSEFTSVGSEMIPGPPCSPDTSFGGSHRLNDEKRWEMQCTKYVMDLLMKQYRPQVNHDAWEEESMVMVSTSNSTRQSLEDELLQVGECFDDDGNVDEGSDGAASVAEQSVEDEEETVLTLDHAVM